MTQKTKNKIAYFKAIGVKFIETLPTGWKAIEGAQTAPNGYVWVHNCKNPFAPDAGYETALLRVQS